MASLTRFIQKSMATMIAYWKPVILVLCFCCPFFQYPPTLRVPDSQWTENCYKKVLVLLNIIKIFASLNNLNNNTMRRTKSLNVDLKSQIFTKLITYLENNSNSVSFKMYNFVYSTVPNKHPGWLSYTRFFFPLKDS